MSNTIGPPVLGTGWDITHPLVGAAHGLLAYEIQDLRKGIGIRSDKEHKTLAASSAGGEHKQGSAIAWIQDTQPTTRPDGTTDLNADDLGRLWYDTTAPGKLKVLTAIGTPDTFTEAIPILDEDDMASDSAVLAPSQQSVKAYADARQTAAEATAAADATSKADAALSSAQSYADDVATAAEAYTDQEVGGITPWPGFGERTANDTDSNPIVKGNAYLAECDGYLMLTTGMYTHAIYEGDAAVGLTQVTSSTENDGPTGGNSYSSWPVTAGKYYEIDYTNLEYVFFKPIGTGGLVKQ